MQVESLSDAAAASARAVARGRAAAVLGHRCDLRFGDDGGGVDLFHLGAEDIEQVRLLVDGARLRDSAGSVAWS